MLSGRARCGYWGMGVEHVVSTVDKRRRTLLVLLTISVFGPYVSVAGLPLRFEQMAVYGGCFVALVLIAIKRAAAPKLPRQGWLLVGLVVALPMVTLLSVVVRTARGQGHSWLSVIAAVDSQAMPVLVLLLVAWLARPLVPGSPYLTAVARTLVIALSLNAGVILIQIVTGNSSWLRPFWAPGGGVTVAELALGNGRYTGVVNQPAEAGLLYGLGLIALMWASRWSGLRIPIFAVVLAFGGLASGSKVFLVAAACAAVFAAARHLTWRLRGAEAARIVGALLLGGVLLFSVSSWLSATPSQVAGLGQLGSVLGDASSRPPAGTTVMMSEPSLLDRAVYRLTAGRFGPGGTLTEAFAWSDPLEALLGRGPGSADDRPAFDNAWVEAFVFGGLIGVGVLAAIVMQLTRLAWWARRERGLEFMGLALVLTVVFATTGFGSLTANRTTSVFWSLFTLLAVSATRAVQERDAVPREGAGLSAPDTDVTRAD